LVSLATAGAELPVSHAAMQSLVWAIAAGIFLIIVSGRLRVPAIVLLLVGGVALGPEGLGMVQPASLGSLLPVIVSLAVGLILFEGGLTLDLRGYNAGSRVIPRLLSSGAIVTWLGAAASVKVFFETSTAFAVLAGSLVIVTGPTVIAPLFKRIKVVPRLHDILHWEAVLIDPIGVFIALLCYEWVAGAGGGLAFGNFLLRVGSGAAIGVIGGWLIAKAFQRDLIPPKLVNAFALAGAMCVFGVAEAVILEAGLLTVTIAGLVVGVLNPPQLKQIRQFKAELTDLLVGLLFIVLAARLRLDQFAEAGVPGILVVACIVLVVRPLNILLSTRGSGLGWREKLFLSWVAPRGIVAASMASLFALGLLGSGRLDEDPRLLETLTYSVIVATVVLQGFSAGWVAKLLGLVPPAPTGWLIAGAGALNQRIAEFIRREADTTVILVDTNARLVADARRVGLPAIADDALRVDLAEEHPEFVHVGRVLALTDNPELNELFCQRWSDALELEGGGYRWADASQPRSEGRATAGTVALPGVPRPSVIGLEIAAGEATLRTVTVEDAPVPGIPLFLVRKGRVHPSVDGGSQLEPGDRVLVLERGGGFLARALTVGAALDLDVTDLRALYERLLEVVVQRVPEVSKDESLADILQPGKFVPTFLGHGIAVPHIYSGRTSQRICILARIPGGLAIEGESEPVRLVFFLVSPAGDPEGHLATLAEIARFCDDATHRERLLWVEDPELARRILREWSP
jgi:NhaP-type Na+/H+ or K+/H+ antiporter/mannitol/fructose-specific phosphotransferase system IIA component (Ntr-type)